MENLINALAKVEALLGEGQCNSGMMGSELNLAKRELERAFGEFQRSY